MINHADVQSLRTFVVGLGIENDKIDKIVGFVQNEFSKA
jgi:hypothetical protein